MALYTPLDPRNKILKVEMERIYLTLILLDRNILDFDELHS